MKIHPAQQNSLSWLLARAGIPTASEWDALISPEWKIRTGEMPKTYLARKVAEAWSGGPLPGFNVIDMDFGKILEEEAIPWFEFSTGIQIQRVGLCTTDDGKLGCSPDGLIGEDSGIEIKCPEAQTHVKYLLNGILPKDYAVQVHGAMLVTGRPIWRFLSYRRLFPPLMLTIQRDEEIQATLREALGAFLAEFEKAMKRLEELNGGPPWRPAPTEPQKTIPEEEQVGLTP